MVFFSGGAKETERAALPSLQISEKLKNTFSVLYT